VLLDGAVILPLFEATHDDRGLWKVDESPRSEAHDELTGAKFRLVHDLIG
jgi:hypothetical protein